MRHIVRNGVRQSEPTDDKIRLVFYRQFCIDKGTTALEMRQPLFLCIGCELCSWLNVNGSPTLYMLCYYQSAVRVLDGE